MQAKTHVPFDITNEWIAIDRTQRTGRGDVADQPVEAWVMVSLLEVFRILYLGSQRPCPSLPRDLARVFFASVQLQRPMSGCRTRHILVQELRQRRIAHAVMIFPIAVCALVAFFLAWPITRASTVWLLAENHPIEWLSALLFLAGGLRGVGLAWRAHKHGEATLCVGFYLVFGIGLLFTAMEEVSWGQQLIGFETPSVWKDLNAQGETTFHNIHGLQGRTELFRLVFGLGGLIGVWVARERTLQKIAAPRILLSWFLVITMHSIVRVFNDIVPVPSHFNAGIDRLSEVIELLIRRSRLAVRRTQRAGTRGAMAGRCLLVLISWKTSIR